jgi:hypothetical protein
MRDRSKMMERCRGFMKNRGGMETMGGKPGGPRGMFESMMGHASKPDDLAEYATPELRTLFEDWLLQLEEEIVSFASDRDAVTPDDVAEEFKVSRDSAVFLLKKLAQKGKININGISDPKEDDHGADE